MRLRRASTSCREERPNSSEGSVSNTFSEMLNSHREVAWLISGGTWEILLRDRRTTRASWEHAALGNFSSCASSTLMASREPTEERRTRVTSSSGEVAISSSCRGE